MYNLSMEMTQEQINDTILAQLAAIQKKLPNGELTSMAKAMEEVKKDISELKFTLLNPENGVIVKTNKNIDKSKELSVRVEELEDQYDKITDLVQFKETVTKVLWVIFTTILGILVTMFSLRGV